MFNSKAFFTIIFAAFVSSYSQPADTAYVFNVEKVANHPPVGFPRDTIPDTCYKLADTIKSYKVRFSFLRDSAFIYDGTYTLPCTKSSMSADKIQYDWGGGRFEVWYTTVPYQAEFTRYGSGVPIIISERGPLIPSSTKVKYRCHSPQKIFAGNSEIISAVSVNGRIIKRFHRKPLVEKKSRKYRLCF